MKTHALTTEQLKTFFDAVGARLPEVFSGQFTTEKLRYLAELNGGFNDWPKHTEDPIVNYVIDCITAALCGDEEEEYDEKIYLEEIEASKTLYHRV